MSAVIRTGRAVGLTAATLAGVAVLVCPVLAAAPAAHATASASQPMQFSDDGVHWSDSYMGALFGGVILVPGGSADRAFYVRNGAAEPAVLRVTLFDVTTTDTYLAAALSLATSMPGRPGASIPVTNAHPCVTLSQGQVLAAGGGIRLDNVAALADLNGTNGQEHTVSFKLAVSLSSTDSAAPAPNSCPSDAGSGTVVGIPIAPSGPGAAPVYYSLGANGWTAPPSTGSGSTADPDGGADVIMTPTDRALVANTERLYQENYVAFWLAMAVLGTLLVLIVRRRNDNSSSQYSPTEKIGTGR